MQTSQTIIAASVSGPPPTVMPGGVSNVVYPAQVQSPVVAINQPPMAAASVFAPHGVYAAVAPQVHTMPGATTLQYYAAAPVSVAITPQQMPPQNMAGTNYPIQSNTPAPPQQQQQSQMMLMHAGGGQTQSAHQNANNSLTANNNNKQFRKSKK